MMTMPHNRSRQHKTPLADAVANYVASAFGRFHVPGHKAVAASADSAAIFGKALEHDLTELPGLDDLGAPSGAIDDAQRLAAEAFGAAHTFFLVGGASAGLSALIWALTDEKKTLALPRNAHRAAIAGMVFSGAVPHWLIPPVVEPIKTYDVLKADQVGRADADAVLILSPSYEGQCFDFESLGRADVPFIVDEAHGSHLYFGDRSHLGALQHEIGACVHGSHKTLGSLTGSGMLHVKSDQIDLGRLQMFLNSIQTSSPSYLMLASLDIARRQMALNGLERIERVTSWVAELKRRLFMADPLRLVVPSLQFGLSGDELARALWEKRIAVEMAGFAHVTLVFTAYDNDRAIRAIEQPFVDIARKRNRVGSCFTKAAMQASEAASAFVGLPYPNSAIPPRHATRLGYRPLKLEEAIGEVSAESVYVYPPGAPLIVQGEVVNHDTLALIGLMRELGVHTQGTRDRTLRTLNIVEV